MEHVGCRWSVFTGGATATVGFVVSRFVIDHVQLVLTFSVFVGFGLGVTLPASLTILEKHFYKKHRLATAAATSGVGLGVATLPLVIQYIQQEVGWPNSCLILALLCATICVASLPLTSPRSSAVAIQSASNKRDYQKLFQLNMFKSLPFDVLLVSTFSWHVGFAIILTHLPCYIFEATSFMTAFDVAALFSVMGVTHFSSRLIFIVFSHSAKLDNWSTCLCTVVLTAIMTGLHTELFKHKAGEIGYCLIFAMHWGYYDTFVHDVTEDFIGTELVGKGKGFIALCQALGMLAGPPIAGFALDDTGSLKIAFYAAGICLCVVI